MFPSALAHVPLVGQPVKVLAFTVLPLLECQCGGPVTTMQAVLLSSTAQPLFTMPVQCPSCGTQFMINGMQMQEGQLVFSVNYEAKPTVTQ